MNSKQHLSVGRLRNFVSKHIHAYPDWKQKNKKGYGVHDAL